MALTDQEDLQELRVELRQLMFRFDQLESSLDGRIGRVLRQMQSGTLSFGHGSVLPEENSRPQPMLQVQPTAFGKTVAQNEGDDDGKAVAKDEGDSNEGHVNVLTEEGVTDLKDLYAKEMAQDHLDLEESVYGSGLLALVDISNSDRPQLTLVERIMALSLLLVNFCVQSVLVWAVATTLGNNPYPATKRNAVLNQRLQAGHDIRNFNVLSGATMTQQYCQSSYLSYLSSMGSDVSSYLLKNNSDGLPAIPGSLICLLAMFIWSVSMAEEFRYILNGVSAILALTLPSATPARRSSLVGDDDGQSLVITTLSQTGKAVVSCLIFIPRLLIATLLLWFGLRYLAHTGSVEDLILNASALLIVKDIDEGLYAPILPRHVQLRVRSTEIRPPQRTAGSPGSWLSVESGNISRSAQAWAALRIVVIAIYIAAAYAEFLSNSIHELSAAYDNLCSQNLTFAYAESPIGGLPLFSDQESASSDSFFECVAAARDDMIRMAAGFEPRYIDNQTLISIGQGWHPGCVRAEANCTELRQAGDMERFRTFGCPEHGDDWFTCPHTSWGGIERVSAADSDTFLGTGWCQDQQGSFMILRAVCLLDSFVSKQPWMREFFENRTTCAQTQDVCFGDVPHSVPNLFVSDAIKKICPCTCGKCTFTNPNSQWCSEQYSKHNSNGVVAGGPPSGGSPPGGPPR